MTCLSIKSSRLNPIPMHAMHIPTMHPNPCGSTSNHRDVADVHVSIVHDRKEKISTRSSPCRNPVSRSHIARRCIPLECTYSNPFAVAAVATQSNTHKYCDHLATAGDATARNGCIVYVHVPGLRHRGRSDGQCAPEKRMDRRR